MGQRPYRELTVDAVMVQTGLTRTAFYRHFADVTDLVLRLFEEVGQGLHGVAERWAARRRRLPDTWAARGWPAWSTSTFGMDR